MALEFKDYYKILGVDRNATADEIRRAFRRLARQYHPDVAKDKKVAEEKFKEINEANEVLSDPEKRKKYDDLGADWRSGFHSQPGAGGGQRTYSFRTGGGGGMPQGFEFGGTGFSEFFEQFFGGGYGGGGPGMRGGTHAERGLDVQGDIMVTLEEAIKGSVRSISVRHNVECPDCRGTGVKGRRPCPDCGGAGQISVSKSYQIRVPAGVHDGQRLRLAGRGEPSPDGGESGDLYLRVRFASHPDFRIENGTLYHDLDLAPWEAALGASVSVPTLTEPVNIKIPAGAQTGQKLRVRGRGMPGPNKEVGDLVAILRVQMPPTLTDEEKELWKKMAQVSEFRPRN